MPPKKKQRTAALSPVPSVASAASTGAAVPEAIDMSAIVNNTVGTNAGEEDDTSQLTGGDDVELTEEEKAKALLNSAVSKLTMAQYDLTSAISRPTVQPSDWITATISSNCKTNSIKCI